MGFEHDVKEYPEAGHSLLNRHGLGPLAVLERIAGFNYHEPSAERAWARILRTFKRTLREESTGCPPGAVGADSK